MLHMKSQRFVKHFYVCGCMIIQCRKLSSQELSTALRPFYFSVHPDLFGQYPNERTTNENSLQLLSLFIETSRKNKPVKPITIKFYLKPQNGIDGLDNLKSINIHLKNNNLKKTISAILRSCNLSTEYVDSLVEQDLTKQKTVTKMPDYNYKNEYVWADDPNLVRKMQEEIKYQHVPDNLFKWLKDNENVTREKLKLYKPIKNEVIRLQSKLCNQLKLKSIEFDCGWDVRHFIGCLVSFRTLSENYPYEMKVLKGRRLMFGRDTGLSLDGIVLLNSGEVRHNWLDFIKNIPKEEAVFLAIPAMEKATSTVLCDIKVVRRKFQPKTMAKQYENNLRYLITSLSDYRGRFGFPKHWPQSLKNFELVVETEAGPLMVSPTGQFIVPSTCPSSLLVNFMSENLLSASELLEKYQKEKYIEKEMFDRCINELNLESLIKDDSITPSPMIECCRNLYENRFKLKPVLGGMRLCVTTYYSVMSDGQICIPWNWNSMKK